MRIRRSESDRKRGRTAIGATRETTERENPWQQGTTASQSLALGVAAPGRNGNHNRAQQALTNGNNNIYGNAETQAQHLQTTPLQKEGHNDRNNDEHRHP